MGNARLHLGTGVFVVTLAACNSNAQPPSPAPNEFSSSAVPGTGLEPPPAGFDPSTLLWVGDATTGISSETYDTGIWIGGIDGTNLTQLTDVPGGGGTVVDGSAYYFAGYPVGTEYEQLLWAADPDSDPVALGGALPRFGVAAEVDAVVVARVDDDGRDIGVWSLPLTGEAGEQLMPAGRAPRVGVATTPDAGRVASGRCSDDREPLPIQLAADDAVRDLESVGIPIGFDTRGGVVFKTCQGDAIRRIDANDEVTALVGAGADGARVTSDGRHLITWHPNEDRSAQELRVTDLEGGAPWSVRLDGFSLLTNLGENEYAVLEGVPSQDSERPQPLVVSLVERWVRLLPPVMLK